MTDDATPLLHPCARTQGTRCGSEERREVRSLSLWLAALAACTASPTASATPAAAAPAATPPSAPAKPATPAPAGAAELAEVALAPEKTSAGGDVLAIGVPRFQLASAEGSGRVILRASRGAVFAEDAHAVAIWDAANGARLQHISPRLDASPGIFVSIAVTADGEWLATGSSHVVRLFRAPFDKPAGELACSVARAFSHGGKLLACATNVLGVWDLAKRQLVAALPAGAPKGIVSGAVFAPDDKSLIWTTERAILRWDFAGAGAITTIYQAPARIEYSALSDGGATAYVRVAGKAFVVDLASAKTASAPPHYGVAVSPSGKRLAMASGGVQVIDVGTGKPVWTAKTAAPATRIAFGETDDAIAYVEAGQLRVAAIPGAPSAPAPTSRFVGWIGPGVAAIERGDALRAFTLATRTWGPADRASLAPKPLTGAPPWAGWGADAPGGWTVAAEPSKRHDLGPDRRGVEPCDPKLRVWTAVGGAKTLTMSCTKPEREGSEDPGWELGGGWAVGVTATKAGIYEPRTGRRVAALDLPPRKANKPEFAPAYWQMALAPAGDWLALIWRQAELQGAHGTEPQDPREDAMHIAETAASVDCVTGEHGCQLEYFVELWNVKGTPRRVWQTRLERAIPGRSLAEAATPTGALAFDPTGSRLLIGFDDGEIRIVSTADPSTPRVERLHRAEIRALSIDPSGQWAFSADAAGEQRLREVAR